MQKNINCALTFRGRGPGSARGGCASLRGPRAAAAAAAGAAVAAKTKKVKQIVKTLEPLFCGQCIFRSIGLNYGYTSLEPYAS